MGEPEREGRLRGIERAGSEITEVLSELVQDVYEFSGRLLNVEDSLHAHPTEGDSAIEERLLAVERDLAQRPMRPIPRTDPRHPQYAGSGGTSTWVDPHPYLVPRAVSVERAERERDEARRGLEIYLRRSLEMEAERNVARAQVDDAVQDREMLREQATRAAQAARVAETKLQEALDTPGTDDRINLIEEARSMLAGYLLDIGEG